MLNWIHSLKIVFLYRLSHFFNRVLWDSKAFNFDEICFFFYYLFMYIYYVFMSPKRSERCWHPKWESQAVLSCLVWVLGIELRPRSSAGAVSALTHQPSQALPEDCVLLYGSVSP